MLLQAQGLIRRNAKLTDKQQKQERICVRFYGALVLQGEAVITTHPTGPCLPPECCLLSVAGQSQLLAAWLVCTTLPATLAASCRTIFHTACLLACTINNLFLREAVLRCAVLCRVAANMLCSPDLISEVPMQQVADKYRVNKGQIQGLQDRSGMHMMLLTLTAAQWSLIEPHLLQNPQLTWVYVGC